MPDRIVFYHCSVCDENFVVHEPKVMRCLVAHPPGTCCHFGEKPISEEEIRNLKVALKTGKESLT